MRKAGGGMKKERWGIGIMEIVECWNIAMVR
jgi:hypothetical protein